MALSSDAAFQKLVQWYKANNSKLVLRQLFEADKDRFQKFRSGWQQAPGPSSSSCEGQAGNGSLCGRDDASASSERSPGPALARPPFHAGGGCELLALRSTRGRRRPRARSASARPSCSPALAACLPLTPPCNPLRAERRGGGDGC